MVEKISPSFEDPDSRNSEQLRRELYVPSPTETAFVNAVKQTFRGSFREAVLTKDNNLVRVSYPIFMGDREKIAVFQYTRVNVLNGDPQILREITPQPKSLVEQEEERKGYELFRFRVEHLDEIEAEMEKEQEIFDALKERVNSTEEAWRSLTDPTYFNPVNPLTQWPERFEFIVLKNQWRLNRHPYYPVIKATPLEQPGMFQGRQTDIYGQFFIAPQTERDANVKYGKLHITFPVLASQLAKAYQSVFEQEAVEELELNSISPQDVEGFEGNELVLERQVYPSQQNHELLLRQMVMFTKAINIPLK